MSDILLELKSSFFKNQNLKLGGDTMVNDSSQNRTASGLVLGVLYFIINALSAVGALALWTTMVSLIFIWAIVIFIKTPNKKDLPKTSL